MWLYHKRQQFIRRSTRGLILLCILTAIGCGEVQHASSTTTEQESTETTDVENVTENTESTSSEEEYHPSEGIVLEKVELAKVVDGDTIWVTKTDYSEKVRLIGIDTPESVHQDASRNNEYGTMASDHTKELLAGVKYVYLEYDKERTDTYERTLAYVWLSEDTKDITNMLNYKIIMDGYANTLTILPNDKYSEQFNNMRDICKSGRIGLWQYKEFESLW